MCNGHKRLSRSIFCTFKRNHPVTYIVRDVSFNKFTGLSPQERFGKLVQIEQLVAIFIGEIEVQSQRQLVGFGIVGRASSAFHPDGLSEGSETYPILTGRYADHIVILCVQIEIEMVLLASGIQVGEAVEGGILLSHLHGLYPALSSHLRGEESGSFGHVNPSVVTVIIRLHHGGI